MRVNPRLASLAGNMRVRILASVVLLLAMASVVSILQIRWALNDRLNEEIATALARESEEFLLLSAGRDPDTAQPFGSDLESLFTVYFRREVPDEGETLIAIIDGELFAQESAEGVPPLTDLGEDIELWITYREHTTGTAETHGYEARYAVTPLAVDNRIGHFVAVNFPGAERREIDQALLIQALIQGLTILVAAFIAYLTAGRVLRPLRSVADTAVRISETDLTRRIPVTGHDEASLIARAFNDMLARLEASFAIQRRFLDEASHEFRAPLTVIRGHLELLELEDDPNERDATTLLITEEIDRMNRMVEDLLTLARAERPDFLTWSDVSARAWTEDVYRKAAVLGTQHWVLDRVADVTVPADEQRLTQAVMQLAANATQHAGEASEVGIGSAVVGRELRVWVRDNGPGVDEEDADRIFLPFQRGRGGPRSSGLGLSIVAAIAEAHGGRVWLDRRVASGARFEIAVPLSRESSPAAAGAVAPAGSA